MEGKPIEYPFINYKLFGISQGCNLHILLSKPIHFHTILAIIERHIKMKVCNTFTKRNEAAIHYVAKCLL